MGLKARKPRDNLRGSFRVFTILAGSLGTAGACAGEGSVIRDFILRALGVSSDGSDATLSECHKNMGKGLESGTLVSVILVKISRFHLGVILKLCWKKNTIR